MYSYADRLASMSTATIHVHGFFQDTNGRDIRPLTRLEVARGQWILVYPNQFVQFRYIYNAGSEDEIICQFSLLSEVGQRFQKAYTQWLKNNHFVLISKELSIRPYMVEQLQKVNP